MPSVEGNENIEEAFNAILKEEYKQEWGLIAIPRKIVALFCYAFPIMMMLSTADYHHHNIFAVLFFGSIIGTGFYSYYRHSSVVKAFFSNDKPASQVIRDVRAQALTHIHTPEAGQLTREEEADWGLIVDKLEQSMEMVDDDSDSMNVSTLFDRAESEQATLQPKKSSWLQRLFGRKK